MEMISMIRKFKRTLVEKCTERRNNLLRRMAKTSTIFTMLVLSFKVHNGPKIYSEIVQKVFRNLNFVFINLEFFSKNLDESFSFEIITLIA